MPGETAPTRPFPGSFDLTPTSRDVNKLSVHYQLNLVPIDEENRRHFRQQDGDLLIKIRRYIPLLIGYLHRGAMVFRLPEVRLNVRRLFRGSDYVTIRTNGCNFLCLTLSYPGLCTLCTFFRTKNPGGARASPIDFKRRSAMVACFLQEMLPDDDSH